MNKAPVARSSVSWRFREADKSKKKKKNDVTIKHEIATRNKKSITLF